MHQAYQDPEDEHSKEGGYLPLLCAHPFTHTTLDDVSELETTLQEGLLTAILEAFDNSELGEAVETNK